MYESITFMLHEKGYKVSKSRGGSTLSAVMGTVKNADIITSFEHIDSNVIATLSLGSSLVYP